MIEVIEFNGKKYPKWTAEGFAAQFSFPFAQKVCKGVGYDIGCNRLEWCLPGAIPIDPAIDKKHDAYNLPDGAVDFVFSSHCVEHLEDWVAALNYWNTVLKSGGVLFLYLPHPEQEYWLPWNNRKHIHSLSPDIIRKYLQSNRTGWDNVFVSEYDLNYSFYAIATKK